MPKNFEIRRLILSQFQELNFYVLDLIDEAFSIGKF